MKKYLFSYCFLLTFFLYSQDKETLKRANEFFNNGNFYSALEEYQTLIESDPENKIFNYRIAVCYLNTNINKSKAIPYLKEYLKQDSTDAVAWYLLGRAYHFGYKFDKAIKAYQKFKKLSGGKTENINDVDMQIEYCYNAKELIKFPIDVSFENLGDNINSIYPDYFPFVPIKENFIVFNSKRDVDMPAEPNGTFNPNIFVSKVKNGRYSKAKLLKLPHANKYISKEVVGLSADGRKIIFYFINLKGNGDLYLAEFDGKNIKKIERLDKIINSKYEEIAATISSDGEKIFFASNRPGGYGGTDIYVSRKLPIGEWGPPQNLGPDINTEYDEDFPNLSPDGKILYFSSKGHAGMGGYDIFKAEFDPIKRKWTNVKNIGFPINTPEDNMNLRISKNGRYGYISALRDDNKGDLDIYRVTFNEIEPQYTVIIGYCYQDNYKKNIVDNYFISVTDKENNEIYGEYLPNPNTGRYIIILPPGKYTISLDADGFKPLSEDIEIYDKGDFQTEINKDFILSK